MKENQVPLNDSLAGKYLTFILKDEIYGIEILKVKEIIGMMKVTRFPKAPYYVRGVINLRGKVIPVIDMRKKIDMEFTEDTDKTCIIVVQLYIKGKEICQGIIIDEVSEVIDIEKSQIELPPSFNKVESSFIKGIGKVNNKVIMLINTDEIVFESEEM